MACRARYTATPCEGRLEVNHVIPRSQGGPSVVANGMPLCAHHHRLVTDAVLAMHWSWLDDDQVEWLAVEGHVWVDVHGPHRGRFAVV